MSKITSDDLTWSGIGCFVGVPTTHTATVGVKGLTVPRTRRRAPAACGSLWRMMLECRRLIYQFRLHQSCRSMTSNSKLDDLARKQRRGI